MEKTKLNLYQKLIEVRKVVPYLKKENSGFQYKYVSSSQVLGSLKEKMDELGLLLIPQVSEAKFTEILRGKSSKGNETVDLLTELKMIFTWINAENPEETGIKCEWYGQGLDTSGEKGVGKALTYAEKYFLLKFFNIPTDKDDPDAFQYRGNKNKNEEREINIEEKKILRNKLGSEEFNKLMAGNDGRIMLYEFQKLMAEVN